MSLLFANNGKIETLVACWKSCNAMLNVTRWQLLRRCLRVLGCADAGGWDNARNQQNMHLATASLKSLKWVSPENSIWKVKKGPCHAKPVRHLLLTVCGTVHSLADIPRHFWSIWDIKQHVSTYFAPFYNYWILTLICKNLYTSAKIPCYVPPTVVKILWQGE